MRRTQRWMLVVGVALVGGVLSARNVEATDPSGFKGTQLGKGAFDAFSVRTRYVPAGIGGSDDDGGRDGKHRDEDDAWTSVQRTSGPSDLYVFSNVWQPGGGSTGWHTHPGHSLIIVTSGAITAYDADTCTPHVYTPNSGNSLVDANHVHLIRNEGSVEATAVVVQLVPAGAARRIDAPAPPKCP